MVLLASQDSQLLPAGAHAFPFDVRMALWPPAVVSWGRLKVRLPKKCPSSLEKRGPGLIEYWLKALVERPFPFPCPPFTSPS